MQTATEQCPAMKSYETNQHTDRPTSKRRTSDRACRTIAELHLLSLQRRAVVSHLKSRRQHSYCSRPVSGVITPAEATQICSAGSTDVNDCTASSSAVSVMHIQPLTGRKQCSVLCQYTHRFSVGRCQHNMTPSVTFCVKYPHVTSIQSYDLT